MSKDVRISVYVFCVTVCAVGSVAAVSVYRLPFPGWWPIATLVFVASLLETLNTQLRLAASGTTSFIIHMAAALLFGGWWAATIVAVFKLLRQVLIFKPPNKKKFNFFYGNLRVCSPWPLFKRVLG